MLDPLMTIEYRKFQPGVVGPVAAGPDDRADLTAVQINRELGCSLHLRWFESVRSVDVVVESRPRCPFVDRVEQAVHLQIGEGAHLAERAGELGDTIADAAEASDDADAIGGECVDVDRDPFR